MPHFKDHRVTLVVFSLGVWQPNNTVLGVGWRRRCSVLVPLFAVFLLLLLFVVAPRSSSSCVHSPFFNRRQERLFAPGFMLINR